MPSGSARSSPPWALPSRTARPHPLSPTVSNSPASPPGPCRPKAARDRGARHVIPAGGRRRDHREVIDAIAFKFRTGTPWVPLPEKYANWRGVHNRLRVWAVDGTDRDQAHPRE
ncbi:transposase [Streptomyces massasporeus]|uniref:transposase n=1 Tax=Streptomyces massasporeus TaxID=67324 RepID=UPI00340ED5C1